MTKRFFLALFLLILSVFLTFAQKPRPKSYTSKKPAAVQPKSVVLNEKDSLEKALAETDLTQKIKALQQFTIRFPRSAEKTRVLEVLVSTQAQLGDQKLRSGDAAGGIELFKAAVRNIPAPISDKLFSEVVVNFPNNLFFQGEQPAALAVARLIEEKTNDNAKQLLGLAAFYLGTENAAEARRLAEKALALEPQLPAAYQTLGLANRLDFQLEAAAAAYARALELDPNSAVSKRSLAEMKRAIGKTEEAVTLYRELLEKSPDDTAVRTGLTLALFNAEKQSEAETMLASSLETNPNNLSLLVGAAYWYAAQRKGDKAVELAQKAVAVEPRYTWARIALARGLMIQGKPLEAEKELIAARQYGNFPTLDYEIASARLAAGFYEEAARELRKNFVLKDDLIETKLGGRVAKQSKNFIELVEAERRASMFEPLAADSTENAERLKHLLRFNQALASEKATEDEIEQAAQEFVIGGNAEDKAKIYRQLYVASRLLQAKKNLPKVLELSRAAVDGVDSALDVPAPAAAVMADELIESRTIAFSRGEVVIVPQIPRQTLLAILRGRIEEISGWTLYHENKPQEAVVRLRRAVSVLPEKSAWWRSSTWKLGAALDAAGKQKEALDIYIKNYANSEPDVVKRSIIETLYQKVNGNLDGLDDKIGAKPINTASAVLTTNELTAQNSETAKVEKSSVSNENSATKTESTPLVEATSNVTASESPVKTQAEKSSETDVKTESSTKPGTAAPSQTQTKSEETLVVKTEATPAASPSIENNSASTVKSEEKPKKSRSVLPSSKVKVKTETPENKATNTETKLNGENEKSVGPETKSSPKPLFDPIVITVPKPEILKIEKPGSYSDSAPVDGSGEARSKVTSDPKTTDGAQTNNPACTLKTSQDSLSLLSKGGNLGILLGFEGEETLDVSQIKVTSSSPADIEVTLEPDIGKQSNRAFYVIKSISPNKGAYTVTFDSPCGKKEVLVKVR